MDHKPATICQGVPVKVEKFEALDPEHEAGPVERVHQLQLDPQVLLGEVIQHPRVHEALHERGPILTQAQRGKPVVANPLVVHVTIRKGGSKQCFGEISINNPAVKYICIHSKQRPILSKSFIKHFFKDKKVNFDKID